jgi:copper chaperone NosL
MTMRRHSSAVIRCVLTLALFTLASCAIAPEAVNVGSDECAHCRMAISEPKYSAQLLTRTGLAHKFDSIECLAAFMQGANAPAADMLHSVWVADFNSPTTWVRASEAIYVQGSGIPSPMGGGLAAHSSFDAARAHAESAGATIVDWNTVITSQRERPHAHAH